MAKFSSSFADYEVFEKLSRGHAATLIQQHWVVIDDFINPEVLPERVLEEFEYLSATDDGRNLLQPNRTSFGSLIFSKPGIFEADLHDAALRNHPKLGTVKNLFEYGRAGLCAQLRTLGLLSDQGTGERGEEDLVSIKLQWNDGTMGCFPAHYDNPGPPSKRMYTAILYLNKNWSAESGGELTLYPFLSGRKEKISPFFNRLVIFKSNMVLHRVEQCRGRSRFCLTFWIDGEDTNSPENTNLRLTASILDNPQALVEAIQMLCDTPLQRSVSRAVYADEYEQSLRECMHGEGSGVAEALAHMLLSHRQHLQAFKANPPLLKLVNVLKRERERKEKEQEQED